MNQELFKQQLEQLSESVWQSLFDGDSLLIKDDKELLVGGANASNPVFSASMFQDSDVSFSDANELRNRALEKADSILDTYYRANPLSLTGFNRQVEALLKQYGAPEFCAPFGVQSIRTLFVEGGEVVAESAESPRHPYGVFFEMNKPMSDEVMQKEVQKWLSSGEAYERYIGMNVCRYSC